MKQTLTYRDITLIIGMIVAVIVAITLYFASADTATASVSLREWMPETFSLPQTMLSKIMWVESLLP